MAPERIVVGVDIGGTKVAAALVRGRAPAPGARSRSEVETPEILDRFTTLTDASSAEACLRGIDACLADLEHGAGRVEGIGLGTASMVDFAAGRVVESVNLPLRDVPRRDLVRGGSECPSSSTTTPPWRPWASTCRRRRGRTRHDHADAGHGVGGGIIGGGRPLRGASGAAGELGHVIVDVDGRRARPAARTAGALRHT